MISNNKNNINIYYKYKNKDNIYYNYINNIFNKKNLINIQLSDNYENADILILDNLWINNKKNIDYSKHFKYNKFNFNDKIILQYNYDKSPYDNFVPYYILFDYSDNDYIVNNVITNIKQKINDYYKKYNLNINENDIFIFKNIFSERGIGTFLVKYDQIDTNETKINLNKSINDVYTEYVKFSNNKFIKNKNIYNQFIIQKYIDNPYLYNKKKTDIASHFILFKNNNSIQFYLHKNILIKIINKEYNNNKLDNEIHLSNRYQQIIENSFLLSDIITDEKLCYDIYNNIKKNTIDMLNTDKFKKIIEDIKQEKLSFCHIFRIDYILTNDFKTFIIEINYSPALNYLNNDININKNICNPIPFAFSMIYKIFNNDNNYDDLIIKNNFEKIYDNINLINNDGNNDGNNGGINGGNNGGINVGNISYNNYYDKYIKYKIKYLSLKKNNYFII